MWERLHNPEKRIKTKTRNRLGDQVKQELAEVKMSMIRKRSQDDNQKKTYERKDSVTVLGMVCGKMADRVVVVRQEEEDRRIREEDSSRVVNLHVDDSTGQEAQEDDEGTADEREICQVTDVTEEDFETTDGESVDLYDKLMAMVGWTVRDHVLT